MTFRLQRYAALLVFVAAGPAWSQGSMPPAAVPAPASAPAAGTQRVDVTGERGSDEAQRRRSTAAKIVIGRDEIERMGDSNVLEILKRLPGITVPGPGGRGGAPRLRGMAGGYTQLLLDGERLPPGFALDTIAPEQIERIEILRAPTAETGARAVAGTINIVLREGLRRKFNEINTGIQFEGQSASPGLSWTRNDTFGDWIATSSLNAFRRLQHNASTTMRTDTDLASGQAVLRRTTRNESRDARSGVNLNARVQWRNGEGESLLLTPILIHSEGRSDARSAIDHIFGAELPDYALATTHTDNRFTLTRVNLQAAHRVPGGLRLEWRGGVGNAHWLSSQHGPQYDSSGTLARTIDDDAESRDRSATFNLKGSILLADRHNGVAGMELERHRRNDARSTRFDGVPQLTEFGDNLEASARRWAMYVQDEWTIDPRWAAHVGLRVESITTHGEDASGQHNANRSRVATPLLHAVWKPDPARRDQVRASLTRSYRSPDLGQLIGRPSLNRIDLPPGPNTVLTADTAGNPRLRPEVALGIDLAFERYLAEGGVLSANLFNRRIHDLIRNVVTLEEVTWSPGQPRYVSRPQNIGDADSQGVELEAKFRLDQAIDDAPKVELRSNLSLFRSHVEGLPGPDNRLAQQPGGTLNVGADYRLRASPLTVGGNMNFTPGYTTRLEAARWVMQARKTVIDAYALWAFSAETKLRVSLGNALAQGYRTATIADDAGLRQTNDSTQRSYASVQARLEVKL